MKKRSLLTTVAIALSSWAFAQTAEVQIIHNSPDAAASAVDVWVNNTKALPNLEFRNATPFLQLPAGSTFELRIQPANSSDTTNPLLYEEVLLNSNDKYVAVANGFVSQTGYSNTPPLAIDVYQMGRTESANVGETDVLVYHGSPDAPTVDVAETSVPAGTIVDDISYGEFQGYLELGNADYTLQIQDQTGAVTVREYMAPLQTLGLADSAMVVLASGFFDPSMNSDGPAFGLFAALPSGGQLIELPYPTAEIQVMHNSADDAASSVDIWIQGPTGEVLAKLDDVEYQTATGVLEVLASANNDLELTIAVAADTSTSPASAIYTQNVSPTANESYAAVAAGIVSPSGYSPATPFNIFLNPGLRTSAASTGETDILVFHGATDAPTVDVYEPTLMATVVDDIAFGEFDGYLEVPTMDLVLTVQDETGAVNVRTYDVPLQTLGLEDEAITVLASGFLNTAENSDGQPFGLYAVTASGGQFIEIPLQTGNVQVIHNSADMAASAVDVYIEGPVGEPITKVEDFEFRTATPFVELPAGVNLTILVAPENSTSSGDAIYDVTVSLDNEENYTAVANGIVSTSGYTPGAGTDTDFDIYLRPGARIASANSGEADVLIFHGSTDAPAVNIVETGVGAGVLSEELEYGDFDGYLELAVNDYTIEVQTPNGTLVASYQAPLNSLGLSDAALTVLASGFLDPSVNSDGAEFGLWVASAAGGALLELPATETSVQEVENFNTFSVYPNPAASQINFELEADQNAQLEIFSISGAMLMNKTLNNDVNNINIETLPAGTYIYRVRAEGQVETGKFNVVK